MKKFLSLIALVGIMASCNNKKDDKDKPAEDTAAKTTTTTTTETTTTTTSGETPKFADAEVQKYVDDYTAFVTAYVDAYKSKDASKIAEWSTKASDWASKSQNVVMKLANNQEEAKKFTDYMTKLSNDITAAMTMK